MFVVVAYLSAGITHEFKCETLISAREMANRMITEGLWVINGSEETFYPSNRIFKVKVCGVAT